MHRIDQGGYQCARCSKWVNDPQEQADHDDWHRRKDEGAQVALLLAPLATGSEFRIELTSSAYRATYRKNADGLWDQVLAPYAPLVRDMDAAHLGFCVGYEVIAEAVA